ncbi:MAG: hypothetical protein ACRCYU_02800 [Nocardioides sp.]
MKKPGQDELATVKRNGLRPARRPLAARLAKPWAAVRTVGFRSADNSRFADLYRLGNRVADARAALAENRALDQRLATQVARLEASLIPVLEQHLAASGRHHRRRDRKR